MELSFERPLDSPKAIRYFLERSLNWKFIAGQDADSKIAEGQNGLISFEIYRNFNTLDHDNYRVAEYMSETKRWELRNLIVNELFDKQRLPNDDDIRLGIGGASPLVPIQENRQAYIIIGLPASGKSGIASTIADKYGATILDSDYAKRKIPEFEKYKYGATLVHKESGAIITGFNSVDHPDEILSLSEKCILAGRNVVIPKIGHKWIDIQKLAKDYVGLDYQVHLTLINLERVNATKRAIYRYLKTDRYVPVSLIFDGYANDPILTYYQLKNHFNKLFASFGAIDTNVDEGQEPNSIDCQGNNPANLYNMKDFS